MVLISLIVLAVIVAVIAIKKKKTEEIITEPVSVESEVKISEIQLPANPGGDPGVDPDLVETAEIVKPKKKKAAKKKTAKTMATKKARVKKSTNN
jgi:hypothetical protein